MLYLYLCSSAMENYQFRFSEATRAENALLEETATEGSHQESCDVGFGKPTYCRESCGLFGGVF